MQQEFFFCEKEAFMQTVETHAAVRGSEAISEEMFGKPSEVSKHALKQLLNITRTEGVALDGWWTHARGRPEPDR